MNTKRLKKFEEWRQKLMADHAGNGVTLDIGYANLPNPFLEGEVIGVDLHPGERPANYNRVIEADALALPFGDKTIDAVVAGELLEHLMDPTRYLLECNRVLRQSGRCVFSVPNPYHPSDIFKNLLLSKRELFTNSHLSAPAFRVVVKLLLMCGFDLLACHGDYLRVPKVHWLIPMQRFPGLAYRNIYAAQKIRDVVLADVHDQLADIHRHEAAEALRRFD